MVMYIHKGLNKAEGGLGHFLDFFGKSDTRFEILVPKNL